MPFMTTEIPSLANIYIAASQDGSPLQRALHSGLDTPRNPEPTTLSLHVYNYSHLLHFPCFIKPRDGYSESSLLLFVVPDVKGCS